MLAGYRAGSSSFRATSCASEAGTLQDAGGNALGLSLQGAALVGQAQQDYLLVFAAASAGNQTFALQALEQRRERSGSVSMRVISPTVRAVSRSHSISMAMYWVIGEAERLQQGLMRPWSSGSEVEYRAKHSWLSS